MLEVFDFFDDFLDGNVVGEGIYVYVYVIDFYGEFDGFFYVEFVKFLVFFGVFDNDEWIDYFVGILVEFVDG